MLTVTCEVCKSTMVWPHDGYVQLVHIMADSHSWVRAAAPPVVPELEHEQGKLPPAPAAASEVSPTVAGEITEARRVLDWKLQSAVVEFDAVVDAILARSMVRDEASELEKLKDFSEV